ncbi:MAG: hypothetical protein FJY88_00055 [Candidatus Eisenbacteria bacterium]|nr:hypothetical protein [Candidatus Eisenbacteria bacterium]
MGNRARACHLAWVALLASGCGIYSFTGSSLPSHIKSVSVPILMNDTHEPALANEVTDAITQRFLQDGRLKIAGESRADCILEGRVVSYENKVHNYSAAQVPEDYIVVMRVGLTMRDSVKNRELWSEESLVVSAVYRVAGEGQDGLRDEEAARRKAIADLAEDVLARTMEQW